MFLNESNVSDSNAFTDDNKDNVPGWRHPGGGVVICNQVKQHSSTIPTDQVPDIQSLDTMECSTNALSAAECRKSDQPIGNSPEVFFSSSVISSSSCPASAPSCETTHGPAEQGSKAMFASHLGSSKSNSFSQRTLKSVSHTTSFRKPPTPTITIISLVNTITTTINDAQAIHHPKVPLNLLNNMLIIDSDIPVMNPPSFKKQYASTIDGPFSNKGWGIPKGLCLRGGGESSLTSGTSSWGAPSSSSSATGWGATPGPQGAATNPPSQWGSNPRTSGAPATAVPVGPAVQLTAGLEGSGSMMDLSAASTTNAGAKSPPAPPASGSPGSSVPNASTWAQAAGKGLPPTPTPPAAGTPSTKQQLEQLNTMREALFSQDGWGGQHVNQDSNWDIPSSPEPGVTKDGVPVWKPNINNGTDLWEANLRNGGQPPPAVAKTPWGHTPTSNIGGTWGEDDEPGDSSNMWTGVPSQGGPPGGPQGPPQWGGANPNQGGMWPGGPKKENEWGSGGGSNWGDPRGDPRAGMDPRGDPRGPMDPRDMRGGDPREIRGGGGGGMMGEHMRGGQGGMDMRGGGGNVDSMMRGGISGRLNGGNDPGMWGGPGGPNQPPHHHNPHQGGPGKMPTAQGIAQWPGPPPNKDLGGNKPSGWEEASPPQQRRNIPNYDDGTSLWGSQPPQNSKGPGGSVSHWREMPTPVNMARGGPGGMPPGMPPNRGLPGNGGPSMKPDGSPLWIGPPRNGSWGDGPHDVPGNWGEEPKGWGGNDPSAWGGPKQQQQKQPGPGGWGDNNDMDPSSWGNAPKQGPKPLTKELVWTSKQFRILADLGYKKEDVEGALRSTNMNLEDAIELLRMNVESWQRHNEHTPGFDHQAGGGFPGQRFNQQPPMPFAPPGANVNSVGNSMNASLANISPAIVQKMLTQQPPPQQPANNAANQQQAGFGQPSQRQPTNQPSTAQLRMLVQQIQMAVQAGYLNHQILNQPLAPQTLLLLNQLLQQIKVLQQLMQQQTMVHVPPLKGNSPAVLHISVQITKTKLQITNLQNQIASQQAIYVKQQQQQNQPDNGGGGYFPPTRPDPLSLQGNFEQLNINPRDPQVPGAAYQSQQSRLNQWKLPSLDKEGEGNEFSRAPGTTSKPALPQSHSSPNMNPLQLGQGDGTWSSVSRSTSDTGWPEANEGNADSKDPWPASTPASAFTDLVPEFEPGKPWKGTQMKSVEDDPSITPGSVGRPLSLALKEESKSPPSSVDTPIPPLSLSSSTWCFNPPSYSGKPGKNTWEAPPPTAVTSELWGAPKARGPPPGLNKNTANGWGRTWGSQGGGGGGGGGGGAWGSSWLILRNLTPQIDGSTLKTLCVQHGPLQNFHLYLNHGIALAKYNSREEANKAQGALNNCVLVNTTIFAESPAESDVHSLLQHLSHGSQPPATAAPANTWRPAAPVANKPADTWAPWPSNPTATSLWGGEPADRATPSSLNSFLPGDLLGGESM